MLDSVQTRRRKNNRHYAKKLKNVHMSKGEGMVSYLTKITHVRDELAVVGEVIVNAEMVRSALNGVTRQWTLFV